MTTIRERSTAALAEALGDVCADAMCMGARSHMTQVRDAIDYSPTVARRLDFATAWDESVAECKRLGFKGPDLMHHEDYTGRLSWIADAGYAPEGVREWGATPTDALVALTEALRERAR